MKYKFYFIRHGEHDILPNIDDVLNPLSSFGVSEIEEIKERLKLTSLNSRGFCANSLRSLHTMTIVLKNKDDDNDIDKISSEFIRVGIIKKVEALQYKPITNSVFKKELYESLAKKKALRFYATRADDIIHNTVSAHSTYKTISKELIDLFLSVFRTIVSDRETFEKDIRVKNFVFCLRKYMYACLRCKITEIVLGKKYFMDYVDWYENNIEFKNCNKKLVGSLELEYKNKNWIFALRDDFGDLELKYDDLIKIKN